MPDALVKPKLAICWIWDSPFTFTRFADSALNLRHPPDYEMRWFRGVGYAPARRHIDALEKALAWGADLLCIIGAAQTYPEDMFEKLVADWEQVGGMIGALVPFRGYVDWQAMRPFQPLAWRLDPGPSGLREFRGVDKDPDMLIPIRPEDGPLQRAHLTGSGVVLFHRDALLSLKQPWFYESVDPKTMHRVADTDTRWVWRMQVEAGILLWIDTTIRVKHCHIFEIDETFQDRFTDWMDPANQSTDRSICRFREELPHASIPDARPAATDPADCSASAEIAANGAGTGTESPAGVSVRL